MLPISNSASIIIAFTAMFGVVTHDLHIDRASTLALAYSTVIATVGADKVISSNYHTHVDRASTPRNNAFRSGPPNTHPPREGDRDYVKNKKLTNNTSGDQGHVWPSV